MCIDLGVCGLCPAGHHSVTTFVFTGSGAPPRPRLCHAPTAAPGHRPGAGRGQVSGLGWCRVAGVCRVSRLHAPLPLCCCNLVSWSPTDCSLRPEAAAESSQLLPPPAALQHGRSCHELHSEAANPITHNLAVPSIGAKSETRQGKYNRLNYFYGCSCGRNYSERMPRCFGGVLWVRLGRLLLVRAGRDLPPYTCQLLTSLLRGYSLLTVHAARAAEDDVTPLLLRQPDNILRK